MHGDVVGMGTMSRGWGCKFIPVSVFRADCMRMSLNVIINLVQLFFFIFQLL